MTIGLVLLSDESARSGVPDPDGESADRKSIDRTCAVGYGRKLSADSRLPWQVRVEVGPREGRLGAELEAE